MLKLKLIEPRRRYAPAWKTVPDFCAAFCALILLSPLMAVLAFGVHCSSRGPIIFRQIRLGQGMEPFVLYKFRTMYCSAPRNCPTRELNAGKSITPFGAFLRKTSLDELPQLFNVLRGEMSLVGPRPVIPAESELIARRACAGAYRVRPGLSGLSQVRGRDLLCDAEKAR